MTLKDRQDVSRTFFNCIFQASQLTSVIAAVIRL
jgi:hypothetical protein